MNKISVDSSNNLIENGTYLLELPKSENISINGEVNLTNIDTNNNLDITVLDNSKLVFYKTNLVSKDLKINLTIKNKAYIELNLLIINTGNNTVTLDIVMEGNDSFCKLKTRILNKNNDKLNFICNGKILSNTYNNELLEDLKGLITSQDTIKISPNIEALTSELVANHLVTIGSFSKEELFYLHSKGISDYKAKELLVESFKNEVINSYLKEKIKMEVISIE